MRKLLATIIVIVGFLLVCLGGLGLCVYMWLHSSSWPEIFLSSLLTGALFIACGALLSLMRFVNEARKS